MDKLILRAYEKLAKINQRKKKEKETKLLFYRFK